MTSGKIMNEEPISMAQLKAELESIKKRDKELSFRSNKTYEYLTHFTKIKGFDNIISKIEKLNIPRLKKNHIIKIMDTMPKSVNDLKVVLQGYTLTINNENMKKILEVLEKEV